ncbi:MULTISPECIES: sulfurtransferase TusA family protein [unclassified Moraxella]|uniref:sulfurtransferase TusA family protein n=1 Tax=unclassified Moraxella TaxID=2685852 RepID=UPI003AF86518
MNSSPIYDVHENLLTDTGFMEDWQVFLANQPTPLTSTSLKSKPWQIMAYVNGKGLACPMPLLKLKMALKQLNANEAVYVTATDPNSQRDIGAFCEHLGYDFVTLASVDDVGDKAVFHVLVVRK